MLLIFSFYLLREGKSSAIKTYTMPLKIQAITKSSYHVPRLCRIDCVGRYIVHGSLGIPWNPGLCVFLVYVV